MQTTKWFPRLTAATTVRTAARTVLDSRIEIARHYLKLVSDRPAEDPEHVHQLRVSTRRLSAALAVFKRHVDRLDRRRLREIVRRVRRAAGAARDLDVLRELLVAQLATAGRADTPTVELLTRGLDRERLLARRELGRVAAGWQKRFAAAVDALRASLSAAGTQDGRAAERLGELARRILPKRVRRLTADSDDKLDDLDRLHAIRIASKRLRYAMELVGHCFPVVFRSGLYDEVELIQEELGVINDLRNLLALVPELPNTESPKRDRPGHRTAIDLDEFAKRVERELARQQAAFVARWPARRQKLADRFERLLARPRPRVAPRPSASS